MRIDYSSRLVHLVVDNHYHDRALILFTMANILPFKAKRVYFLTQLKMLILRKTKNIFQCVFKALFTLYSVKQCEILHGY